MTIVITAKRDGFRRCGIAHPGKPTFYPDDFFTEEQLEALGKEPQLILAYAGEAFDQVKDELDDSLSQTPPSQAPDAIPGAQPQASETVTAPVVAPVVDGATTGQNLDQSGPVFVGPVLDLSKSDIDPLKEQDNTAPPVTPPPAPVAKPVQTRTSKAKETGK
jgi:hypothetical protein